MHSASLTKWPSGSEPGGGDRGESCSPSPSPLSPSFRRKRLRKSSTGSTSGSGDKPEEMNEITLVATNIVKPEPLIVSQENNENVRRPVNTNTESQGSIDEDQISIVSIFHIYIYVYMIYKHKYHLSNIYICKICKI